MALWDKAHGGTDKRGIVHSLTTTDANAADIGRLPQLLHGEEKELFADPLNRSRCLGPVNDRTLLASPRVPQSTRVYFGSDLESWYTLA